MMRRRVWRVLVAGMLVFFTLSCQKKAQVKGIELTLDFSESPLTDNLMTDIRYTWKTSADFVRVSKDYYAYVHFWHGNNLLFQDDHVPSVPTSKWEPGKVYSYERKIYIPSFIDEFDPSFKGEETLKMSVGFYNPYDRSGESKREILVKKLKFLPPPPDTPEIIYESGWYDLEIDPESHLKQWRWTSEEARCLIDNPRRDARLVIRGQVNKEATPNQKVTFKINDQAFDELIGVDGYFEKSYTITKEMLTDEDEFYLVIACDQTFVPAEAFPPSRDDRKLGIQVSLIYFR
ncbi:MAG: hypothetical protein QHH14_07050 [Clostridiales bacterium]|nr:hypothetical protein [Clostridiales bacterium]